VTDREPPLAARNHPSYTLYMHTYKKIISISAAIGLIFIAGIYAGRSYFEKSSKDANTATPTNEKKYQSEYTISKKLMDSFSPERVGRYRIKDAPQTSIGIGYTYDPLHIQLATFHVPIATLFDPDFLAAAGYGGEMHSQDDFTTLFNAYADDDEAIIYAFTDPTVEDGNWWYVTVIPNKTELRTMDQFTEYFAPQWAGGVDYPKLINDGYLVFTSSCGTGAGAPEEIACYRAQELVEPTLLLR
jgi:hypothetical protein